MHFVHRPYIPGETIAAIATPPGEGGIAIIRISGSQAIELSSTFYSGPLTSYPSHTAHLGKIYSMEGEVLDEVLLLLMRTPRSFTGEDTVEIHCHGGSLVARKILERALQAGARAAKPGEFSFRAFKNGKIDLAQAEAIQSVISAKNELAYAAAENQLQGALSQKIRSFQQNLLSIAAILEAWVDFPEEGLDLDSTTTIQQTLLLTVQEIRKLHDSFEEGRLLQEGISLCLAGPPNAGKSSLMNALLGKERAIVTNIAGTTRDVLEEGLLLGGLHFRLLDTAGIRETEEIIEKEGIRRSKEAMEQADLVLLILDASTQLSQEAHRLLATSSPAKTILVWNKKDLAPPPILDTPFPSIALSALTQEGLQELQSLIATQLWSKGPPSKEEVILTSARHKQALAEAIECLESALSALEQQLSPEFISFDVRKSLAALGTIIGLHISEDILTALFSQFCVGK